MYHSLRLVAGMALLFSLATTASAAPDEILRLPVTGKFRFDRTFNGPVMSGWVDEFNKGDGSRYWVLQRVDISGVPEIETGNPWLNIDGVKLAIVKDGDLKFFQMYRPFLRSVMGGGDILFRERPYWLVPGPLLSGGPVPGGPGAVEVYICFNVKEATVLSGPGDCKGLFCSPLCDGQGRFSVCYDPGHSHREPCYIFAAQR